MFTHSNVQRVFCSHRSFARAASITILGPGDTVPAGCIMCPCIAPCRVNLLVHGHLAVADIQGEVARLQNKEVCYLTVYTAYSAYQPFGVHRSRKMYVWIDSQEKLVQKKTKLEARIQGSGYVKVPEKVRVHAHHLILAASVQTAVHIDTQRHLILAASVQTAVHIDTQRHMIMCVHRCSGLIVWRMACTHKTCRSYF